MIIRSEGCNDTQSSDYCHKEITIDFCPEVVHSSCSQPHVGAVTYRPLGLATRLRKLDS